MPHDFNLLLISARIDGLTSPIVLKCTLDKLTCVIRVTFAQRGMGGKPYTLSTLTLYSIVLGSSEERGITTKESFKFLE